VSFPGDACSQLCLYLLCPSRTVDNIQAHKNRVPHISPLRCGIARPPTRTSCIRARLSAAPKTAWNGTGLEPPRKHNSFESSHQPPDDHAKKHPKIENARDRSLWRLNLDHSQYSRCCVLQLPQWPPSSFRWRCYHWLRWLSELRLASALCTPARPVANPPARIGFVSFGSTGCKLPTRVGCSAHPFVLWRSIKLAPDDPGFIGLAPNNSWPTWLAPRSPSSG